MKPKNQPLSLRELQVLRLAAEGHTAKATAVALHLSESAVNLYVAHARHKLGAKTKCEAISMLMDTGNDVIRSILHVQPRTDKDHSINYNHLHEMQKISVQLRHLLETMLIADVSNNVQHADMSVWMELAEKLLRSAVHTFGYEMVKACPIETAECGS